MVDFREELLIMLQQLLPDVQDRFKVKTLGVFGSFSRNEMKGTSDVDILVEFQEGQKTFSNFMELKFFLEGKLSREIDIVTREALHPKIKSTILESVLYA